VGCLIGISVTLLVQNSVVDKFFSNRLQTRFSSTGSRTGSFWESVRSLKTRRHLLVGRKANLLTTFQTNWVLVLDVGVD
jgi:hypothetical protein